MKNFSRFLCVASLVVFAGCNNNTNSNTDGAGGSGGGSGGGSESALSSDATLASLNLDGVSLDQVFQETQASYTAGVGFLRTLISVSATTSDVSATVTVNGEALVSGEMSQSISLAEGSNTVSVVVTAEDGSTQTYSVDVTRQLLASLVEAKHTADDAALNDNAGVSVALAGDTALVGASGKGGLTGAAYIFTRSGGVWSQQAKLVASDAEVGDRFGESVALAGDTVLVGAAREATGGVNAGAAYVFTRSGGVWSEQAKLAASDLEAGDRFGVSVALAGETALVGARSEATGGSNAGAAYVFTRSGGVWSEQSKLVASDADALDFFGSSVALEGETALVGAGGESTSVGAAYVFTHSGGVWSEQAKLVASDAGASDYFAWNGVALSGDTALVGSEGESSDAGAAYVFTRSGGVWSEQAKLVASDAEGGDFFGWSVALEGDTALIGAYYEHGVGPFSFSGASYVFTRSGGVWSQQTKLVPSDLQADDEFGYSVALSGETALVGSWYEDGAAAEAGAFYFFQ